MKKLLMGGVVLLSLVGPSYATDNCIADKEAIQHLQQEGFSPVWVGKNVSGLPTTIVQNSRGLWIFLLLKDNEYCEIFHGTSSIPLLFEPQKPGTNT